MTKYIGMVLLAFTIGCGSEALTTDAGTVSKCQPNGTGFSDTVNVADPALDGGTCTASYSVTGGPDTFNCDCPSAFACAQAFEYLDNEAKACKQGG